MNAIQDQAQEDGGTWRKMSQEKQPREWCRLSVLAQGSRRMRSENMQICFHEISVGQQDEAG